MNCLKIRPIIINTPKIHKICENFLPLKKSAIRNYVYMNTVHDKRILYIERKRLRSIIILLKDTVHDKRILYLIKNLKSQRTV